MMAHILSLHTAYAANLLWSHCAQLALFCGLDPPKVITDWIVWWCHRSAVGYAHFRWYFICEIFIEKCEQICRCGCGGWKSVIVEFQVEKKRKEKVSRNFPLALALDSWTAPASAHSSQRWRTNIVVRKRKQRRRRKERKKINFIIWFVRQITIRYVHTKWANVCHVIAFALALTLAANGSSMCVCVCVCGGIALLIRLLPFEFSHGFPTNAPDVMHKSVFVLHQHACSYIEHRAAAHGNESMHTCDVRLIFADAPFTRSQRSPIFMIIRWQ